MIKSVFCGVKTVVKKTLKITFAIKELLDAFKL